MKKLIALLTLTAAPVIGFAGIAHAAPQDQPWGPGADGKVHLPDGTCYQPLSNPPLHVDCNGSRATATYVAGERFADDPVSTAAPDQPAPGADLLPVIPPPPRTVKKHTTTTTAAPAEALPLFIEMPPFADLA